MLYMFKWAILKCMLIGVLKPRSYHVKTCDIVCTCSIPERMNDTFAADHIQRYI